MKTKRKPLRAEVADRLIWDCLLAASDSNKSRASVRPNLITQPLTQLYHQIHQRSTIDSPSISIYHEDPSKTNYCACVEPSQMSQTVCQTSCAYNITPCASRPPVYHAQLSPPNQTCLNQLESCIFETPSRWQCLVLHKRPFTAEFESNLLPPPL